jgi:protein-tyrosine phosphatase
MASVAFICTANRCRSVMAHAIFVAETTRRSLAVQTYSAGVCDFRGAPPVNDTTSTCDFHQTPAPEKVATWIGELSLDSIDRFLVMERYHMDALIHDHGVRRERVTLLGDFDPKGRGSEIDDPFGQGPAVYTSCYNRLRDCIVNYLDTNNELA